VSETPSVLPARKLVTIWGTSATAQHKTEARPSASDTPSRKLQTQSPR